MSINIRAAQVEDCPGIARVQVDSYRNTYASFFPPAYFAHFTYEEQAQDWRDLLAELPGDILLVAENEAQEIIGYLLARVDADLFPGYDAEIIALHVRGSLQRRGTGSALLGRALEILLQRGCTSAMLWTIRENPVRRWYESLGGQWLAEKQNEGEGWAVTEVAYGWKDLPALLQQTRRSR